MVLYPITTELIKYIHVLRCKKDGSDLPDEDDYSKLALVSMIFYFVVSYLLYN